MPRVEPPADAAPKYRPIAPLAIAGLLFGLVSPLVFLINATWLLLAGPVAGLVLCLLARRQIRRAEGGLAGYHVVTVGIVLCVASGLGWLTARQTEQYIVVHEAETFLRDWLVLLQSPDKEGEAFLATMEPRTRQLDFPANDHRRLRAHFPPVSGTNLPAFDLFRAHPFTSLVLRYPGQITFRPIGLKPDQAGSLLRHVQGSYGLKYAYHLSCPALEGEVVFDLNSATVRTERGPRREWRVSVIANMPSMPKELTVYGRRVKEAESDAARWIINLVKRIHVGDLAPLTALVAPESQAGLREITDFVRKDLPAQQPSTFTNCTVMLLHDKQVGTTGWDLGFRVQIIADRREFIFDAHLTSEGLTDGTKLKEDAKRWKLTQYQFLALRKLRDTEGGAPQAPELPSEFSP